METQDMGKGINENTKYLYVGTHLPKYLYVGTSLAEARSE